MEKSDKILLKNIEEKVKTIIKSNCQDALIFASKINKLIENCLVVNKELDIVDLIDFILKYDEKILMNFDLIYGEIILGNKNYINKSVDFMLIIERYTLIRGFEFKTEWFFVDKIDPRSENTALSLYIDDIKDGLFYSRDEEFTMFEKIRTGDELAKKEFLYNNLKLVITISKRYQGSTLGLEDLIQEGNIGLMNAVDRFDHTRGYKFSTYATWWIKQSVLSAIYYHGKDIRVPAKLAEKLKWYTRFKNDLSVRLGCSLTFELIVENSNLSFEDIKQMEKLLLPMYRLDSPLNEETDTDLGSVIEDVDATFEYDNLENQILFDELFKFEKLLDERSVLIIKMRFGFEPFGKPHTLEEVGRSFEISRERVRQIEEKALNRLMHDENIIALAETLCIKNNRVGDVQVNDDIFSTRGNNFVTKYTFEDCFPNLSKEYFVRRFPTYAKNYQEFFGEDLSGVFDRTTISVIDFQLFKREKNYINKKYAEEVCFISSNKYTLAEILEFDDLDIIREEVSNSTNGVILTFYKVFGIGLDEISDYSTTSLREQKKLNKRIIEIKKKLDSFGISCGGSNGLKLIKN